MIEITVQSNNPSVAGVYTFADEASAVAGMLPVLATFTGAVPNTLDDVMKTLISYGFTSFLNYV